MNIRYGRSIQFGRHVWAAPVRGRNNLNINVKYLPDCVQVVAYNKDGTKSAIFGNDTEEQGFDKIQFEITNTGCGAATISFKRYPTFAEIPYGQRLDIHLYADSRPWWSGYVLSRPDNGGTEKDYKIVCHGFYNALKNKLIFGRYQDVEISKIVIDICRQAEADTGIVVNTSKIYNTNFKVSDIVFDGINIQECLKQLAEFAVDWVYGIDEYREVYFKKRNDRINEEARFWVGRHLNEYIPSLDVDKVVNWAKIKGAKLDSNGEQWLTIVEDIESQQKYGRREAIWSLPSAYSEGDAERWGMSELRKYKDAVPSAKVKGLILEYPRPDGKFWVRKLSTDGQAAITNSEGTMTQYPITKLKYSIDAKNGIVCEMDLGEQPFILEKYLLNIERSNKNNELLQQASNKQLR